ncbi:MAG TPA: RdgB/HAM1 family non-canonical purine NTP pyrophosphatase [Tepidisphaeraceae bacterium]|jgi:XTP/dITP diphosphohydrolase
MQRPETILIATGNRSKAAEFAQMLPASGFTDLSAWPGIGEMEETGHTFRVNACLKAIYYAKQTSQWAIADDSGLEVDALNGSPGVYSARWAQRHDAGKGDRANNDLLIRQLADVPDAQRSGRFVCVLALADPLGRVILTARDTLEGKITFAPRGENGFGYDPFFAVPDGRTSAELTSAEKHAISHRGRALRQLRQMMDRLWPKVRQVI